MTPSSSSRHLREETHKEMLKEYLSSALPATLLLLALFYNGPQSGIPWLAFAFLVAVIWMSAGLGKSRSTFAATVNTGWLPVVAGLYLAWLAVASRLSIFPHISFLDGLMLAILPMAFFTWLLLDDGGSNVRWRQTWTGLAVLAFLFGLWGAIQFLVFRERAHGTLLDPNAYASVLNLFLLPVCYRYLARTDTESNVKSKWLGLIAALAMFQFVALSRGATLALAATLVVGFGLCPKRAGVYRRALVLLAVLVACFATVRFLSPPDSRFERLATAPYEALKKDSAITDRFQLWSSAWAMFREGNMLTGSGLGTFRLSYPPYRSPDDRTSGGHLAHNDYLQSLQEGGVVFFSLLFTLTVVAPLWLLREAQRRHRQTLADARVDEAVGLVLGIVAISLHALVNFIHYILPIAFISGLYLSRSWQILAPNRFLPIPRGVALRLNLRIVRPVLYVFLVIPVLLVLADTAIFMTFRGDKPLIAELNPTQRVKVIALSLAVRPSNLLPREELIRALVHRIESMRSPEEKAKVAELTLDEIAEAQRRSPGLALWPFLKAKVHLLTRGSGNLEIALEHLEHAVSRAPNSFEFRAQLVRVLRALGKSEQALSVAGAGKQWIELTDDFQSLHILARDARDTAGSIGAKEDQRYWDIIADRVSAHLASIAEH